MRTPEEIQKEIDQNADDRRVLERVKNELTARIAELVRQLAEFEAKNPKRRHGDFGISGKGHARLVIESWKGNLTTCGDTSIREDQSNLGDPPDIIFGNIFDIMKGWGEPFERFEFDVHHCEINTVEFAHAPIHIAGNWHTEAEAYEIWCKLGHALMTLKKQQK